MGCCQYRDLGEKRTALDDRIEEETTIDRNVSISEIKGYFAEECWGLLVLLVKNPTPIKTKKKFLWTESPKTIGCLAVAYLATQALNDPSKISKELEQILPFVLNSIRRGSDDLRENCLLALYGYANIANDMAILRLLDYKVFNILVRFFMCNKIEMQMLCANICNIIYSGRTYAQVQFLNDGGDILLMNLIQWSSADKERLAILIGYMHNLLLDAKKYPQTDICMRMQKLADILRDIRDKWIGSRIYDRINDLLKTIMFY